MSDQPLLAPRIVLVDGANTLYRAFFAIPPLRAPDGTPTNAALGFANMLRKVMREEQPDAVVVVFDARGKSFRHELYPEYKATRDAQPEDLSAQLPLVRELLDAWAVPVVEAEGFEADDVIATLVTRAPRDAQIAIVTTDRDLFQLVDDRVCVLDGIRDRRYGPAEVKARFGVPPEHILDLRALVGDTSDNIPGVKGIGEKGAAQLVERWGDLETLIAHRDEISNKRARTALGSQVERARLSKRLSTLRTDVAVDLSLDALPAREPDRGRLRALFERLGFQRLLEALDAEAETAPARAVADAERVEVERVEDARALAALAERVVALPSASLLFVTDPGGSVERDPVGLAVALDGARAAWIPIAARGVAGGLALAEVAERLSSALADPAPVAWIGRDTKRTQVLFAEADVELPPPHFDAEIAAQLLDPAGSHALPALAAQYLDRRLRGWEDLAGRGAKARPAAELPAAELADWAAAEVCAARDLCAPLQRRLDDEGLAELFESVEMPLTRVLAGMERAGVRVDERVLERLSGEYRDQLARTEARIHELAGEPFLISSPKQLQKILFEKLKLRVIKKTKTGYSTDEDVLEQLAADHELPALVLAHRRLTKLKNTYVDALPPLIHPATGRIHPTFHQLGAATGRLSAANPNVQNIPIRTEEGVRIREAFVAADGCRLLSADYSQVELRILAHYSQDESLIAAFRDGEDVHRRTAAAVAGVDPEQVSAEQRARAKAVNFGIIYGSSAFGLARQLGIASAEAQETIDAYFERYRGVRRFLDETVAEARRSGTVRTLLGRKRQLPDLGSRNRALRNAAERVAVNTVIQGTAADLIKKAMLAVDAALREEGLDARMILQVHDELVFEVPAPELEAVRARVRARMEGVMALRVPLQVDLGVGDNWREAH